MSKTETYREYKEIIHGSSIVYCNCLEKYIYFDSPILKLKRMNIDLSS